MRKMAANSNVFLNLLKELGCPDVENLEAKDLDWLFYDKSCKEFITSICTHISRDNLLTDDEIERFRQSRGPILQGKYLEQALSGLKEKEEEKPFWERQRSINEQQLKTYQEVVDELDKRIADAYSKGEKLRQLDMESHNILAFEERKLKEVEANVKAAKETLQQQILQLRELSATQEPAVLNHCSLKPLEDELSQFDSDLSTCLKRQASVDIEMLLEEAENVLSSEELKDYAGTFSSKEKRAMFLEDIKAKYPIILKKYFDRKVENAGLKAEMEKLEKLEKTASTTESRLDRDVEVEELEASLRNKVNQIPPLETPYPLKIAVQELNQELLKLNFAWKMCEKVEDWICDRLTIAELVDLCLKQECKSIDGLRWFLEDFVQRMKERHENVQHSLDIKPVKEDGEDTEVSNQAFGGTLADSTKSLFAYTKDVLNGVKRLCESVRNDNSKEIENEMDALKASTRKNRAILSDVPKEKSMHEQACHERSQLKKFLDRDLWVYFYLKPEKLNTIAENFRK